MGKASQKIIGIILTLALLAGSFATATADVHAAAKKPVLNRTGITLTVGDNYKLKVSNAKKVTWSSSKKSVAAVSKYGTVKAKKAGKATITAKVSGKKLVCRVTVRNKKINSETQSKILVAYFSWSGTSERIAENIIKQTGADSFRIERAEPYSSDYSTVAYGEAKTEADTNARPEIKNPPVSISQYKKVVLCYPIWWHTAPMTVGTFLEKYDFEGITVYPVSQSASMDTSQFDESVAFIKSNAKNAAVDKGLFSKNSSRIENYIKENVLNN